MRMLGYSHVTKHTHLLDALAMGRRAKYFTLAEKASAQKIQREKLKDTPEAIARRKAENRRQYLKRKPSPTICSSVERHSRAPMSWTDWRPTFERFYHGEDTLFLGDIELGRDDFEAMGGLPPYYGSLTVLGSFEEVWGELSAALHGYMTYRYINEVGRKMSWIKQARDSDVREELWGHHRTLMKRWKVLTDFLGVKSILHYAPSELIAMINMQWTSRLIVFAVEDLEAFGRGRASFLRMCSDRLWEMGLSHSD
ncbi:hypothetical protein DFP72DRAFT_849699 [Ephemerocybe angulata]|uniref:Uncharacterized protein n=1 Tax=Ephemerocybe angulata TaxID=980116 RepID=A0A8H6HSU2_9AGAR|nr:hypothetical protein DFP72DRAFT_849699 [Tulosesus angulatus]